ncbi:hypothetical protein JCM10450v2_001921 [Rhodotorula kratochvilovae]
MAIALDWSSSGYLTPRYWGLKPPSTIKALALSGQTYPLYHDHLAASRLTHLQLGIALVDVRRRFDGALDSPYLNNLVSVTVVGNTRCQSVRPWLNCIVRCLREKQSVTGAPTVVRWLRGHVFEPKYYHPRSGQISRHRPGTVAEERRTAE